MQQKQQVAKVYISKKKFKKMDEELKTVKKMKSCVKFGGGGGK